ncbi:MAG: terminase small subunit [Candidatus Woesebacteria bacterium]|nr:MAG: terminase small subunit [Candidatus Woesebacteria bacterium]
MMLKPRHQKFVRAFVENGGNATRAAQVAGYGSGDGYSRLAGHRLITNDNIKNLVVAEMEATGLGLKSLVRRLRQVIFHPQELDGISVTAMNAIGKWQGWNKPLTKVDLIVHSFE